MGDDKDKDQVRVSVILPSLNVARYIRECVESVINQTLHQIEILCVDAGSTDGTVEILEQYASMDERIRIIRSDRKSYGYQINLGIREAKGRYIGIVETDDFINASMYEKLYSCTEGDYPDFVKGGFYDYAEIGDRKISCASPLNASPETLGKVIDLRKEREKGFLVLNRIWVGIYRREFLLYKGIKFNESPGASYQDTGFSLLVGLLADTGAYVEGCHYYYRRNNENSSVRSSAKWRCVVDEVEYVMREMVNRGEYSMDTQLAIWKYKPVFYSWNFLRLPEKERELFLAEIRPELERYAQDGVLYNLLSDSQKEMVEMMSHHEAAERYFAGQKALEEKYMCLLSLARQGGRCVLVSAGNYGKCLLSLQEIAGIRFIDAVADNLKGKREGAWNGYIVTDVPEAVHKYDKHWFIVANKRYFGEIREQLTRAGIREEKILVFDRMLSVPRIMELLIEGKA